MRMRIGERQAEFVSANMRTRISVTGNLLDVPGKSLTDAQNKIVSRWVNELTEKYTQTELEKLLRLGQPSISRVARGVQGTSVAVAIRAGKLLGVERPAVALGLDEPDIATVAPPKGMSPELMEELAGLRKAVERFGSLLGMSLLPPAKTTTVPPKSQERPSKRPKGSR